MLDALGLEEATEAGAFLTAFDALLGEAVIPEALVSTHMGHSGERARGDSRLLDWPEALWSLIRERGQESDSAAPRYLTAYGRDVQLGETRLDYDPKRRRLTLADGSRSDAKTRAALLDLIAYLTERDEELSLNAIETGLATKSGHPRQAIRDALRLAVEDQTVLVRDGERNAKLHYLNPSGNPQLAKLAGARRSKPGEVQAP